MFHSSDWKGAKLFEQHDHHYIHQDGVPSSSFPPLASGWARGSSEEWRAEGMLWWHVSRAGTKVRQERCQGTDYKKGSCKGRSALQKCLLKLCALGTSLASCVQGSLVTLMSWGQSRPQKDRKTQSGPSNSIPWWFCSFQSCNRHITEEVFFF